MLSRMLPLRLDGNLQKSGLHTSQHLNKPSFGEAWIRAWETGKQQTNKRRARSGEAADSVGDAFGPRAPETERVNRLGLCSSLWGGSPPPPQPTGELLPGPGERRSGDTWWPGRGAPGRAAAPGGGVPGASRRASRPVRARGAEG